MKFMTTNTIKDVYYTLPQAERAKINAASVEFILNLKKKMGDKLHFYSTPEGRLISIGEYGSIEEYSQSLQTPRAAAGYVNYECVLLTEVSEKAFKAFAKSARAAKK